MPRMRVLFVHPDYRDILCQGFRQQPANDRDRRGAEPLTEQQSVRQVDSPRRRATRESSPRRTYRASGGLSLVEVQGLSDGI